MSLQTARLTYQHTWRTDSTSIQRCGEYIQDSPLEDLPFARPVYWYRGAQCAIGGESSSDLLTCLARHQSQGVAKATNIKDNPMKSPTEAKRSHRQRAVRQTLFGVATRFALSAILTRPALWHAHGLAASRQYKTGSLGTRIWGGNMHAYFGPTRNGSRTKCKLSHRADLQIRTLVFWLEQTLYRPRLYSDIRRGQVWLPTLT